MTSRIDSSFIMSVQVTRRGFPTGKKSEKQRFARGRQPQNQKNSVSPAGDDLKIRKNSVSATADDPKIGKMRFQPRPKPQNLFSFQLTNLKRSLVNLVDSKFVDTVVFLLAWVEALGNAECLT